jgi:hypothetical protein
VLHTHGVLAIIDVFHGAGFDDNVTGRLHFAPELDVGADARSGFVVGGDRSPLAWVVSNARQAQLTTTRHSDQYASWTAAPTIELAGTSDRPLIVVIGPADVPQQSSIAALSRLASDHGIHFSPRELAK